MMWYHLFIYFLYFIGLVSASDTGEEKHRITVLFTDLDSKVRLTDSPKSTLGHVISLYLEARPEKSRRLSDYLFHLESNGKLLSENTEISNISPSDSVIATLNSSINNENLRNNKDFEETSESYVEIGDDEVYIKVALPDGIIEDVLVNRNNNLDTVAKEIATKFGYKEKMKLTNGQQFLPGSSTLSELGIEANEHPLFLVKQNQYISHSSKQPKLDLKNSNKKVSEIPHSLNIHKKRTIPGEYILKPIKIKLFFLSKRIYVIYEAVFSHTIADIIYDINTEKQIPLSHIKLGIFREGQNIPESIGLNSPEAELSLYEMGIKNNDIIIVATPDTDFSTTPLPIRQGSQFRIHLNCLDKPHSRKRFSVSLWSNTPIDSIRIALSKSLKLPFTDIDLEIEDIDANGQAVIWRRLRGYTLSQLNIVAEDELYVRTGPYRHVTVQPSYLNPLTGRHEIPMNIRIRFDDYNGFDLILGIYPSTTIKQLKRLIAWRRNYLPNSIQLEIIGIDRRLLPTSILPSNDYSTLRQLGIISGVIFRVRITGSPIETPQIPIEDIKDQEYIDGASTSDPAKPSITLYIVVANRHIAPIQVICFPSATIRSIIKSVSIRRNIPYDNMRLYTERILDNGTKYRRYYEKLPDKTVEELRITRNTELFVEIIDSLQRDEFGNLIRPGIVNLVIEWDDGTSINIPVPLASKLGQFRGTLAGLKGISPEMITLSRRRKENGPLENMINLEAPIDAFKLKDGDIIYSKVKETDDNKLEQNSEVQRFTGLRFSYPDGSTIVSSAKSDKKLSDVIKFLADQRGFSQEVIAIYFSSGRKLRGDNKTLKELGVQSDMQFWVETDNLHLETSRDPIRYVIRNTDSLWSTFVFISPDEFETATVKDLISEYKSKMLIPKEATIHILGYDGLKEDDLLSKYENDERFRHLLVEVKIPSGSRIGVEGYITGEMADPKEPIDKLKKAINWQGSVEFVPKQNRGINAAKAETTHIGVMMPAAALIRPQLDLDEDLLQAFGEIADAELNNRIHGVPGRKMNMKKKENLVSKLTSTRVAAYILHLICNLNNLAIEKFMLLVHKKPPYEARKCTKHLTLGLDKYYRFARSVIGKNPIKYKKAMTSLNKSTREFKTAYNYVVVNSRKMARTINKAAKNSGKLPESKYISALRLSGKLKYDNKLKVDLNLKNLYITLRPVATQDDIEETKQRERDTSRRLWIGS
ncbi:hypothetical protein cand_022500 [Cryptosporidium andersoni]|uniref:Ubiquitin-like domain-containing protein n=1 Tax=Cryptosporidium andersoni TaxID=117008 RepID=A0A1J4MTY8_9CRYT|nr:hypothetical protein cand_022500 [Cryptosporidium andersoni]